MDDNQFNNTDRQPIQPPARRPGRIDNLAPLSSADDLVQRRQQEVAEQLEASQALGTPRPDSSISDHTPVRQDMTPPTETTSHSPIAPENETPTQSFENSNQNIDQPTPIEQPEVNPEINNFQTDTPQETTPPELEVQPQPFTFNSTPPETANEPTPQLQFSQPPQQPAPSNKKWLVGALIIVAVVIVSVIATLVVMELTKNKDVETDTVTTAPLESETETASKFNEIKNKTIACTVLPGAPMVDWVTFKDDDVVTIHEESMGINYEDGSYKVISSSDEKIEIEITYEQPESIVILGEGVIDKSETKSEPTTTTQKNKYTVNFTGLEEIKALAPDVQFTLSVSSTEEEISENSSSSGSFNITLGCLAR